MTFVTLKIYNFKIFGFVNELHTEIIAYGASWSFSQDGIEVSSIVDKDNLDGYKLIKTEKLGFSALSKERFHRQHLPGIVEKFTIDAYDLYSLNCRHFSLELIKALRPSRPERGLYLLGQLNYMSAIIGRIKQLVITNTVRYICYSPLILMNVLFRVLEYCNQGRILKFSRLTKDYIAIGLSIVLILFWTIKHRL